MFKFNKEDHEEGCCPKCGCKCNQSEAHTDHDFFETEIDTPENILNTAIEVFMKKGNINNKDDLTHALGAFFNEVYAFSKKEFLIDSVDSYMEAIRQMDSAERNR